MSYSSLLAKTFNQKILFSVLLELTYNCNLNCFYCYNNKQLNSNPLKLEQYITLLEDLKEMGTLNVTLTGGEPLLHPHFFQLGRTAKEYGFVVRIKSNGHDFFSEIAKRVRQEIQPFVVEISLHGCCAETHDRQTRVPGSFNRLIRNVKGMIDAGLRVQFNSTLTSWNENEFTEMFALADSLGIRLQMDTRVTPRDNKQIDTLQILPSLESIEQLLTLQSKRNIEQQSCLEIDTVKAPDPVNNVAPPEVNHCCGTGLTSLTINPSGTVYPCVQWRKPVGNLHKELISSIWEHSKQLKEIRKITGQVKKEIEAKGLTQGGFCPALAEITEGAPDIVDSRTKHRIESLKRLGKKQYNKLP